MKFNRFRRKTARRLRGKYFQDSDGNFFEDLSPEIQKLVDRNFWNMVGTDADLPEVPCSPTIPGWGKFSEDDFDGFEDRHKPITHGGTMDAHLRRVSSIPEGRSVSEHCRATGMQACGHCDDLQCGDNLKR